MVELSLQELGWTTGGKHVRLTCSSARRPLPLLDPLEHLPGRVRVVEPHVQNLPGLGVDDDLNQGVVSAAGPALDRAVRAVFPSLSEVSAMSMASPLEAGLPVLRAAEDAIVDLAAVDEDLEHGSKRRRQSGHVWQPPAAQCTAGSDAPNQENETRPLPAGARIGHRPSSRHVAP